MDVIDVLTVSKRVGWFDIALESILRQQMNVHWIIVDENIPSNKERQMMFEYDEFVIMVTHLSAPPQTRASNLNASENKGLRFCQTDTVIFYQDFIVLQENCFAGLVDLSNKYEGAFIGTVTKNPPGEKEDPRYLGLDLPRPCTPDEWEGNVGLAPMQAMYALGGFDERLDDGWAWDNVNVAQRAAMLGYKFYLDESNRPQLLRHEKEKSIPPNGERNAQIIRDIQAGKEPIKLAHLDV